MPAFLAVPSNKPIQLFLALVPLILSQQLHSMIETLCVAWRN